MVHRQVKILTFSLIILLFFLEMNEEVKALVHSSTKLDSPL